MQNGRAKLPDVFITDKNDTFHFNDGATTGHFRLLALAMRRDELGNPVPVEGVGPAVSNSFVVSEQQPAGASRRACKSFQDCTHGRGGVGVHAAALHVLTPLEGCVGAAYVWSATGTTAITVGMRAAAGGIGPVLLA